MSDFLSKVKYSLSPVAAVFWYLFELSDGVVGRKGEQQSITFSQQLRVIATVLTGGH